MSEATQLPTEFKASLFQQGIFDWIRNGRGDGIVNAVAGSGKTTTLVQSSKLLFGDALFVAFSKEIQLTLQGRIQGSGMISRTVHSIGYQALRSYIKVPLKDPTRNKDKINKLARRWLDDHAELFKDYEHKERVDFPDTLTKLCNMARVCLSDPRNIRELESVAWKFGIDAYADELYDGVLPILKDAAWLAQDEGVVDFTDYIWLPWYWDLPVQQYSWVFVDECQDLSAAQLDLVLKCRAKGGRMLFVGDPHQAIFGFAGADCESYWKIKTTTNAQELPLSVCYRCPSDVLKLAREIVPQIEARDDAPAGVIVTIKEEDIEKNIKEGDMILCRKTAPLVRLAIELIAKRIPARVRGRDIGRELGSLARKVADKCKRGLEGFAEALNEYHDKEAARLMKREGNEDRLQSLADKVECIFVIFESFKGDDLPGLLAEIDSLFTDERSSVTLCTIHRAKGLENDRVFILHPEDLPLIRKGQLPWQIEQERNLKYVALTRAKKELYFVTKREEKTAQPKAETEVKAA